MKKIFLTLALALIAGSQLLPAQANDRERFGFVPRALDTPVVCRAVPVAPEPPPYCPPVAAPSADESSAKLCNQAASSPALPFEGKNEPVTFLPSFASDSPGIATRTPYLVSVPVLGLITGHGYRPHFFGRAYESHPPRG